MTKDTGSPASYDERGRSDGRGRRGKKCAPGVPPLHPLSSQRKALPLSWPSCVKSPRCPLVQAGTRSKIAHAQRGWFPQARKHGERNNSLGRLQHTLAIHPAPAPQRPPSRERNNAQFASALALLDLTAADYLVRAVHLPRFGPLRLQVPRRKTRSMGRREGEGCGSSWILLMRTHVQTTIQAESSLQS